MKIKNKNLKIRKSEEGWRIIAEESMKNIWNNKKDEEVWVKYL